MKSRSNLNLKLPKESCNKMSRYEEENSREKTWERNKSKNVNIDLRDDEEDYVSDVDETEEDYQKRHSENDSILTSLNKLENNEDLENRPNPQTGMSNENNVLSYFEQDDKVILDDIEHRIKNLVHHTYHQAREIKKEEDRKNECSSFHFLSMTTTSSKQEDSKYWTSQKDVVVVVSKSKKVENHFDTKRHRGAGPKVMLPFVKTVRVRNKPQPVRSFENVVGVVEVKKSVINIGVEDDDGYNHFDIIQQVLKKVK